MYWFISDEHYFHTKMILYSNRPFSSVEEEAEIIIQNHNSVVNKNDTVIHAGDTTLIHNPRVVHERIISRLNGNNIFLRGSHDYWINHKNYILELNIEKYHITICHYCMRVWPRSHYNSWHLFGHSHNKLEPVGKSLDIGVDGHNFFPWSFDEIKEYMKDRPDNFNLVKKGGI